MNPTFHPHIQGLQTILANAPLAGSVSTGCGVIDGVLGGGFQSHQITEVYGETRVDRSTLLIQTALTALKSVRLQRRVLFLTGTRELDVGLLRSIAGPLTRQSFRPRAASRRSTPQLVPLDPRGCRHKRPQFLPVPPGPQVGRRKGVRFSDSSITV